MLTISTISQHRARILLWSISSPSSPPLKSILQPTYMSSWGGYGIKQETPPEKDMFSFKPRWHQLQNQHTHRDTPSHRYHAHKHPNSTWNAFASTQNRGSNNNKGQPIVRLSHDQTLELNPLNSFLTLSGLEWEPWKPSSGASGREA